MGMMVRISFRSSVSKLVIAVVCCLTFSGFASSMAAETVTIERVLLASRRPSSEPGYTVEAVISERLLLNTWQMGDRRRFIRSALLNQTWRMPQSPKPQPIIHNRSSSTMDSTTWIAKAFTEGRKLQRLGSHTGFRGLGAHLLDAESLLATTGSLVKDPSGIFGGLDVAVNCSTYTLELYGIRWNGEKVLLYSARVGLGSPEYPTPRGSFFLTRIFDDNPLWIPPPSDWAWGQLPSHSVYGGHMLPLLKKMPITSPQKGEEPIIELDVVASPMKMVDGGMYRIHGTDSPWSIGSGQSHGCIRMLNSSVKQLADQLKMYVGVSGRGETANGPYASLARPVRLLLF